MSYKDTTFCASQNCKNACGRKMTEKDRLFTKAHPWFPVSYAYFCDESEIIEKQTKRTTND